MQLLLKLANVTPYMRDNNVAIIGANVAISETMPFPICGFEIIFFLSSCVGYFVLASISFK